MGPIKFESIGGKKYIFLTFDDFSTLTWVRFLHDKLEKFTVFSFLWSLLITDKGQEFRGVSRIRSDHRTKFQNSSLLFALNMALNMNSLHQNLHNKMEWLTKKIVWSRRWHGLCYIAKTYPNGFGLKLSSLLSMLLTVFISSLVQKPVQMRYGQESSLT